MGLWSQHGPIPNQAWHQNKEGLTRAVIEGKNVKTKAVKELVSCNGQDFRNFNYMAAHGVHSGGTEFLGMTLMMREKKVEILRNGHCKVIDLTEREKTMNLATYGA